VNLAAFGTIQHEDELKYLSLNSRHEAHRTRHEWWWGW